MKYATSVTSKSQRETTTCKSSVNHSHWHHQMLPDRLPRLGPASSASHTLLSNVSTLGTHLEHGPEETVFTVFTWGREQPERDREGLMEAIDHLFIHSERRL